MRSIHWKKSKQPLSWTRWTHLCWQWEDINQQSFPGWRRLLWLTIWWSWMLSEKHFLCVTVHPQKNVMLLGESVRLVFKALHPAFMLNTWLNVSLHSTLCLYFALLLSYLSVAYVSARWPHLDPVLHWRRYIYSHSTHSLQTSFCHLNSACDEVSLCLHSHWSQARR